MVSGSRRDAESRNGSKSELRTSKLERIAPKVDSLDGRGITYLYVTATLVRTGTEGPTFQGWRGVWMMVRASKSSFRMSNGRLRKSKHL